MISAMNKYGYSICRYKSQVSVEDGARELTPKPYRLLKEAALFPTRNLRADGPMTSFKKIFPPSACPATLVELALGLLF